MLYHCSVMGGYKHSSNPKVLAIQYLCFVVACILSLQLLLEFIVIEIW